MPASVGIVWGVPVDRPGLHLITDLTPLDEAEPYGECLTHARGHYEMWEHWRRLGHAGLKQRGLPPATAFHEYEDCPRGRVVFHTGSFRFTLYADPRLWGPSILGSVFRAYSLDPARCGVRFDPHDRTTCASWNDEGLLDTVPGTTLVTRPRNEPGYPTLIVKPATVTRFRRGGGVT